MTKLQFLNVFLTERLMLAAQEIYKSVEDTILEYQEEISIRERENDYLRRRLRDAGIEVWPDRPSMALLEEEDADHPRREWSPSMGHEERVPLQPKDKHDLRDGSCSASENMFPPPRVTSEYPPEVPQTSTLPPNPGVENRQQDRGMVRHVKSESGGAIRNPTAANSGTQPLAPVNPNCPNDSSMDLLGVDAGGQAAGAKGATVGRGHTPPMRSSPSNSMDCPHQKSPLQGNNMASFSCKVCGEAFSHIGHLHVHVQVHTREKPYRCGVCGKCCSSSGRLQEHQRSHTGEKPFRCQICGNGFTQMAHLKVHMRIHTGEKPYSCPVCGKCFSRSDKIKRHLQTHSREGSYFPAQ